MKRLFGFLVAYAAVGLATGWLAFLLSGLAYPHIADPLFAVKCGAFWPLTWLRVLALFVVGY